jgi:hypothetical protein
MKADYLLPLLLACACGGTAEERLEQELAGEATASQSETDAESGLTAVDAGGVWIFTYESNGISLAALWSGETAIVSGCLVVRDAVVAWPTTRLDEALAYVDELRAGAHRVVDLGGAGISTAEGFRLPSIVTDRCEADVLWGASPER